MCENDNFEIEKEFRPLTPYSVDFFTSTFEQVLDDFEKFSKFLFEFYLCVHDARIDNKTLGIFFRMIDFLYPNGIFKFFTYKIRDDEKEVINAIKELEKEKFIKVTKIEKIRHDAFVQLQLVGDLRKKFDEIFKEQRDKKELFVSSLHRLSTTGNLSPKELEKELKKINMGYVEIYGDRYYADLNNKISGILYKPVFDEEEAPSISINDLESAGVIEILEEQKTNYGRWLKVKISGGFREVLYKIVGEEWNARSWSDKRKRDKASR